VRRFNDSVKTLVVSGTFASLVFASGVGTAEETDKPPPPDPLTGQIGSDNTIVPARLTNSWRKVLAPRLSRSKSTETSPLIQ